MFSIHQLGTAYFDLGDFERSHSNHSQALELARVLGDHAQVENSEHELGMLDFLRGNLLDAIGRFRRGIEIANQTGRSQFVGMDLQHIGISLMEARKVTMAGQVLNAALQHYKLINDEVTESELQSYICQHLLMKRDYSGALAAAEAGYSGASRFQAQEFQTRADFMIGLVRSLTSGAVTGRQTLLDAIHFAEAQGFKACSLINSICVLSLTFSFLQNSYESYSNGPSIPIPTWVIRGANALCKLIWMKCNHRPALKKGPARRCTFLPMDQASMLTS